MTMNVPLRFLFISNAALRANASAATSSAGSPLEMVMVPFVDQATQPNHWEEVSEMALSGAHRLGDATTTTLYDTGVKLCRL